MIYINCNKNIFLIKFILFFLRDATDILHLVFLSLGKYINIDLLILIFYVLLSLRYEFIFIKKNVSNVSALRLWRIYLFALYSKN